MVPRFQPSAQPHACTRALLLLALAWPACSGEPEGPVPGEELSAGALTVFDETRDAFGRPIPTLSSERLSQFFVGNSFFNNNWVAAPASTATRDGLGPTFNARSCASCHFKDGRGRPPESPEDETLQLLVRLSVPGEDAHGGPKPEPTYGGQLNHQGIPGVPGEGTARLRWEERDGAYLDGTPYRLRRPAIAYEGLAFGPLAPDVMSSPRVAPPVFGLGLLEAVPERVILEREDPEDRDGDGISGRANRVWSATGARLLLGRFGWKANQPDLLQQTAGAFVGDIGITSPLFAQENCPEAQLACRAAPSGGAPEIDAKLLERVSHYMHMLAVPARRAWMDVPVLRGRRIFRQTGCEACHRAELETGALERFDELEGHRIRPYTDLLLHDMGEELADARPDFGASGQEWRTPPLWGIGLVERVNRHTTLLHDGRARDVAEAILWHGGEAEAAREAFRGLSRADREALLAFVESL